MKRMRSLGGLIAAASIMLALAGCGSGQQPAATSSSGHSTGVFTMDFASDFPTLDPAAVQDVQSNIPMDGIYDGLVTYATYGSNTASIIPDLATWTASTDGLTYTFHLKHGIRFSNGDPLTAQDVKYSLDRMTSWDATGSNGPSPFGSDFSDIVGYDQWFNNGKQPPASVTGLSGITTPDPYTVVIKLTAPQAYFLNEMALPNAYIVDPAVTEKYGPNLYAQHAVGTGPYMLDYWTQNKQMVLVPNPYYKGPQKAQLKKIIFNVNVQAATQFLLFEKGQVDMIFQPDSATYLAALNSPTLAKDYIRNKTNAVWYLAYNVTKAPFNNVKVRQAVNLAIDRNQILKLINGRGLVETQLLPPAMPGYDTSMKGYAYDPTQAKKLLQEAGYGNGFSITLAYTSARPFVETVMQNIQAQLAKVGITVNLHNIPETGTYWPYTADTTNNWDLSWTDWWQDYPDPQDFMFNLGSGLSSNETGGWKNTQFDNLVTEADNLPASQDTKRWQLYDQAQQIWFQQAPWVPLYYPVIDAMVQPWVQPQNVNALLHPVIGPQIRLFSVKSH